GMIKRLLRRSDRQEAEAVTLQESSGAPSRVSADVPIASSEADRFGVSITLIPRLARVTIDWPGNEGLVVRLYGPWGIGKTSILNLLAEYITANRGDREIILVRFSPWFYEDASPLITGLFGTIAGQLRASSPDRWGSASRALSAMGTFLTVASKGVSVAGVRLD